MSRTRHGAKIIIKRISSSSRNKLQSKLFRELSRSYDKIIIIWDGPIESHPASRRDRELAPREFLPKFHRNISNAPGISWVPYKNGAGPCGFHAGFERCGYRNRYQPWQRAAIRNERVEPLHFFPLSGARRLSRLVPAPLSSERAKQKRRKEGERRREKKRKRNEKKRNEKKRKEGKRQRSGRKGKTRSGSEERTNREERLVWKVRERRREKD